MIIRMKLLLIIIFLTSQVFGESSSLMQLRFLFKQGANSRVACKQLIVACDETTNQNISTVLGYKGCANMMLAKYGFNPISKFNAFNYGKSLLEQAIRNDSKNIELIFLRFVIQLNSPSLLNYHDDISADKLAILLALPTIKDHGLSKFIRSYLVQSTHLTAKEKIAL